MTGGREGERKEKEEGKKGKRGREPYWKQGLNEVEKEHFLVKLEKEEKFYL